MNADTPRFNGKLVKWNADRGFGFVAVDHSDLELFVHVTAFLRGGQAPSVGELLSFEIGQGQDGRKQAVRVRRRGDSTGPNELGKEQGSGRSSSTYGPERTRAGSLVVVLVVLLLAAGVAWMGYSRYSERQEAMRAAPQYNSPAVVCDGRKYCSQMTSCSEAKLFLKTCPGVEMDGDHDGIPCEQQWCTGLFGG